MTQTAARGLTAAMPDAPMPDEPASTAGPSDEDGFYAETGAGDDARVTPLIDDLRRLAADAKTLAEAELAYQTSRAAVAGGAVKGIALYGALAAALVLFALLALTVGLLLALTPLVTAWGATAIVVGGLVLGVVLCVGAARRQWNRVKVLLSPGDRAS